MQNSYIQDLTACGLLQEEAWQWLQLKQDGFKDDINELQHRLPARSESTIKRYLATLKKRYQAINDGDLKEIATSYDDTFKQFNLLLLLLHTRILGDFITEVICPAKRDYVPKISIADIERFFEQKQLEEPELTKLSDSSLKKVKSSIVKIMVEASILSDRRELKILNLYPLLEVERLADKYQLTPYLKLLECKQ
ncbi:MAG: DUF1819 family protein [Thiomicrospira sp.]|jgi:hypothetical protein|nr:DUF1819 family protein [Thiomicrospira sp.]